MLIDCVISKAPGQQWALSEVWGNEKLDANF